MARAMKNSIFFIFIFLGIGIFNPTVEAETVPDGLPREGDVIPAFSIPTPGNSGFKSYLMLKKGDMFRPADMDAKLLILEVLNVY